jgi:hypothetical protein
VVPTEGGVPQWDGCVTLIVTYCRPEGASLMVTLQPWEPAHDLGAVVERVGTGGGGVPGTDRGDGQAAPASACLYRVQDARLRPPGLLPPAAVLTEVVAANAALEASALPSPAANVPREADRGKALGWMLPALWPASLACGLRAGMALPLLVHGVLRQLAQVAAAGPALS